MKKFLVLMLLTASASLLQADGGCSSCGGCNQGQGPYYQGQPYGQSGQYQGQPYGQQGMYNQNQQYGQPNQYQGQPNGMSNQGMSNQGMSNGQNSQGYSQNMPYSQNNGSAPNGSAAMSDQDLQTKIQNSLRSSFSSTYNGVNVSVNSGNVTLTGTVPSQDDKNSLEQKVRGMDGVRNVNNQVSVQPQK